jgi:hypothetical protein
MMFDHHPKANPFCHMGRYYWTDADDLVHGPFKDARSALQDLLRTQDPLFFEQPSAFGNFIFQMSLIVLGVVALYWVLGK